MSILTFVNLSTYYVMHLSVIAQHLQSYVYTYIYISAGSKEVENVRNPVRIHLCVSVKNRRDCLTFFYLSIYLSIWSLVYLPSCLST